jgi:hypothetical protein
MKNAESGHGGPLSIRIPHRMHYPRACLPLTHPLLAASISFSWHICEQVRWSAEVLTTSKNTPARGVDNGTFASMSDGQQN